MSFRFASCLLLAAFCAAPLPAQDLPLRERLRERQQERSQTRDVCDTGRPITQPGDYRCSLEHGGMTRQYLIHVPRSHDPAKPAPLLLAFHGGGGNMEFQADDANYGLKAKSEAAGFIVVFPNGYSPFPGGKLATWNAGACCAAARDKQIDDVGFVRALLARVQKQMRIDPRRVYATGMSNGAMLAHRLACEMADVFAGIAAVAGTDNTTACKPSRPVPVLVIHARNDDHVLFGGGAGPGAFRDESKVADFTSVPETVSRWARRNACSATPVRVLQRAGATCERYAGCRDEAAVQLCVTDTGGHSWPGAAQVRRGKEQASQAISAADVMWDFFSGR